QAGDHDHPQHEPKVSGKGQQCGRERENCGRGKQNPARAVKNVQEDNEDATEHHRRVQRSWNPGGLVETQTEGTTEVCQADAEQTRVQRGKTSAQEYSRNSYVWVGNELWCGPGLGSIHAGVSINRRACWCERLRSQISRGATALPLIDPDPARSSPVRAARSL